MLIGMAGLKQHRQGSLQRRFQRWIKKRPGGGHEASSPTAALAGPGGKQVFLYLIARVEFFFSCHS
jgi:hypothetical protein